MTDNRHPTAPYSELYDPDLVPPPKNGEHLLLINPGGCLIIGTWSDDCLAWGYKPKIPASVKAKLK